MIFDKYKQIQYFFEFVVFVKYRYSAGSGNMHNPVEPASAYGGQQLSGPFHTTWHAGLAPGGSSS